MAPPEKQWVVSAGVSKTSYAEVVELCRVWALEKRRDGAAASGHFVCATSVHGIILAKDDAAFAGVLASADVVTPDGMPLVWALRSFGNREQQRVYGPTLMLKLCESAAKNGLRIFLYGGHPEALPVLENHLVGWFPGLRIVGSYSPPFRALTEDEEERVRGLIRGSDADIVFVGIGTPKQEQWMHAHRQDFPGVTLLGVGAAFDFHAGRTAQAPAWMQRNGLEWLFRLVSEPGRLWRRYLLLTPRFLPLWLGQRLKTVRESRV